MNKYFKQEPIQRRFDFSGVPYFGWPNQPSSGTMRVFLKKYFIIIIILIYFFYYNFKIIISTHKKCFALVYMEVGLPACPYKLLFFQLRIYMIGEVSPRDGLPSLPDRATHPAGVAFCHVNLEGEVTRQPGAARVTIYFSAFRGGVVAFRVIMRSHSTGKWKQEKLVRVKEH